MKNIEIDDELYQYIVSNTQFIGESASSILRRLLVIDATNEVTNLKPIIERSEKSETNQKSSQINDSVFNYIDKEKLASQRGAAKRFLFILAALYRAHSDQFYVVSEIRGRNRLYFALNKDDLLDSGNSSRPTQITGSPYWVITNSNTVRKKMILTKAANGLGYKDEEVEEICELL